MLRDHSEDSPTLRRVAEIFRHKMNLDVPSADADLFETGLLDSLRFVPLLISLPRGIAAIPSCRRVRPI